MKTLNILMTGVGAPGAPSIINCLRNNGERELYIVGVDMNKYATCRTKVDNFYTIPHAEDPTFIDEILNICENENIDIVLSIVTRELEILAVEKERFENLGVKLLVMDYEPLHIANNKGLLLNAMKEAGIRTPSFRIVNTPKELEIASYELDYPNKPVVIKPTYGNGSRGTRILDESQSLYDRFFKEKPNSMYSTLEDVMNIFNEKNTIPEMMVMEYLPGADLSVDILANKGEVLYVSCRRGNVVSSIMVNSIVDLNYDAIELCKQVTKVLKLDGNMGFDTKEDVNGIPQLMEINPRLPAGVVASVGAGINFPYLGIKRALGEKLSECTVKEGVSMQLRNEEILYNPDGTEMLWNRK